MNAVTDESRGRSGARCVAVTCVRSQWIEPRSTNIWLPNAFATFVPESP